MEIGLCKRKARRVIEEVGIRKKVSPLNHLPDECIFEIFSYSPDPADRWSCAAVCKKWLLIQAHMKRSDFKIESASQLNARDRMKRCLEDGHAVDTRLAAMAVRKWARGIVSDLSIRGDFLGGESSYSSPPHGVTDCGLDIVGSGFPCLKSLALWGCLNITNKGLVCVSRGCVLLEKLDLCECPLVTDEGMVAVARGLKRLTTLSVDSCRKIGDISLKAFGAYTPSLHSLSVKGCLLVGDEGVFSILAGLPNLKRLRLAKLRSNLHAVLALVRHCKALTSLSLEGYSFGIGSNRTGCANGNNGESTGLLRPSRLLRFSSSRAIGKEYANLKIIAISRCKALNDEGLVEIGQRVVALEKLTLEACQGVSLNGLTEFLAKYANNLKSLSLVKCNAFKETSKWTGLASLPSCNKLETLMISFCPGLGDDFLAWIGTVSSNLRETELIGLRDLSDVGVHSLLMGCDERTKTLDRVILNGCTGLSDITVLVISRSFGSELKTLGISECQGMTSQSLQIIASHCSELRDLDISGNEIKDGDLAHLNKMFWLASLNLKRCAGLNQNVIDSFEASHFECDLVY